MAEKCDGKEHKTKTVLPPYARALSPLTRRILVVNIVPVVLLAGGLLLLDQYRAELIKTELDSMRVQADMIAAALGENAVIPATGAEAGPGGPALPPNVTLIVRRLAESSGVRARLFDTTGALIADTRYLNGPTGTVQIVELPPPDPGDGLIGDILERLDAISHHFPWYEAPSPYGERIVQRASHYAETATALEGERAWGIRRLNRERQIFTVATPVQHYKHVMGALMLSKDSHGVDDAILDVRIAILEVSAAVLALTVLLSLYLGSTIARPIRRLAGAAERVRKSLNRQHTIPDISARDDEIGELAIALRDMTDALWRRMDAIESFAADVAHEIKNPLTSLQSAVETAARIDDPERKARLMDIIADDVGRLDRLITDIADASRLDSELSRTEPEPVDVGAMLETLADMHAATATDGAPKLRLDLAPEVQKGQMTVPGMESRLVQVFRNLIGNAVTFSPPDGTITVSGGPEDGTLVVTIDDQGPGIPPGKENAIFDRFYTERPAAEKFGTHSGLGLSISRQIVAAHGGTLTAENLTGAGGRILGARFTVHLPRA